MWDFTVRVLFICVLQPAFLKPFFIRNDVRNSLQIGVLYPQLRIVPRRYKAQIWIKLDVMKKALLVLVFLLGISASAQVGISNTDPKAQLDISASNAFSPSNTDGLLIPRINFFPAINPTAEQNGILVFLTNFVVINAPGFY